MSRDDEPKKANWWRSPHKLLVAGEVDYVTRKPESWWSNVLVLPNFDIGDRLKFDPEGKIALSAEAVSLRGRRLEGGVFVSAHLKKADFTGAELARADFAFADLREAKFECNSVGKDLQCAQLQDAVLNSAQLEGASLNGAQLQGALLNGAQLQGASLNGAQLQGASLNRAQLPGASLNGAQLQSASLNRVRLQGALLVRAGLQGASLTRAELQSASLDLANLQGVQLTVTGLSGASLRNVFVWRSKPPVTGQMTGALIENPKPEPKYSGLNCGPNETCDWRDEAYSALKALVEAIPAGSQRNSALKRIESLGQKPFEEDGPSAKAWRELVAETRRSEAYPGELAKRLIGIGCAASEAPYVVGGLTEQLDVRFNSHAARAEVARAFLDEENCPGAQGLSEAKKSKLRQILGPTSPRPSPGAASR